MDHSASLDLRAEATAIVKRLHDAGFDAFWVGGCVRDFLLDRSPSDFDIATSAQPPQVEAIFKRTIPVGKKFGVVIVVEVGHQFQVATFRDEADYRDGRHPQVVTFADARADALRRDFTINGLFYDPVTGKLHDWVGGEKDLRAGVVRTIGEPAERFGEDHLRLLRVIRLAAQLDFQIDPGTFAAVKALAKQITGISAERIRDELIKLFRPPHAARGLELLRESNLLQFVLPELVPTIECDQSPNFHPEGTVYNHLVLMLRHLPPNSDPNLAWAVLLHDIAKPVTSTVDPQSGSIHFYGHEKMGAEMASRILARLKFSNKDADAIVQAVYCHMQFKDALQMKKSTLRRMLMRENFDLELQLHRLDCLGSHQQLDIYAYLVEQARELENQPAIRPPLLKGEDLIALGVKPGPEMGKLLHELREKQLQDELKSRDEALKWMRERLSENPPGSSRDH